MFKDVCFVISGDWQDNEPQNDAELLNKKCQDSIDYVNDCCCSGSVCFGTYHIQINIFKSKKHFLHSNIFLEFFFIFILGGDSMVTMDNGQEKRLSDLQGLKQVENKIYEWEDTNLKS